MVLNHHQQIKNGNEIKIFRSMSDKIEYSRLLMKRSTTSGEVPTIPPVTAVTLNQFTPTDIFVGEFFLNAVDDLLWIRTDNDILPISLSGSSGSTGSQTLTQVLFEGNVTGGYDIEVSSGDTIIYSGLPVDTARYLLGVDADGRTILTSGGGGGVSGDYLPLSGGTVTGNTYFGATSGITLDQVNNRIGIGTSNPQNTLEIYDGSGSVINYKTTAGGTLELSGSTNLPRYSVGTAPYLTNPLAGVSVGMRAWDDTSYPGYGAVGDAHLYASNDSPGLNIINRQGTTEDYIRFYAGTDADGNTADIHIQGYGGTRGYVGLGTEDPKEKLDVVGNVTISGDLTIGTVGTSTPIYNLGIDSSGLVVSGSTGGSGDSLWTSGSTVGSVTSVVGGNTNTAPYSIVVGTGNTLTQTHSVDLAGNIVVGQTNDVDAALSIVVGLNNTVNDPVGAAVFGTGHFVVPNYATVGGGTNVVSTGSSFSTVFGWYNSVGVNSPYSAIIGGNNNTITTTNNNSSILGGNNNYIQVSDNSSIIGGKDNYIFKTGLGRTLNTVVIGGQDITGNTDNMVYVPNLTIVSATTGTSVATLAIDSTGKVITTTIPSGTSGTSGTNGTSGTSGANGTNGTSGTSGANGTSGTSGANGTSGTSGANGTNGTSGTSGISGDGLYLPLSGGTVTGNTTFTADLYLSGLTSGGSSTYLTIDSDTGKVYTATGGGGGGTSGTSGTSGGGGGSSLDLVTGVTLSSTGWTFNSPYYEYTVSNTGITSGTKVVSFTPYNSSVFNVLTAQVYPYILVSGSLNRATIYADYIPAGDITGDLIIQ